MGLGGILMAAPDQSQRMVLGKGYFSFALRHLAIYSSFAYSALACLLQQWACRGPASFQWKDRESKLPSLWQFCLFNEHYIGIGMKAKDTESLAVPRPVKLVNLLGIKVSQRPTRRCAI